MTCELEPNDAVDVYGINVRKPRRHSLSHTVQQHVSPCSWHHMVFGNVQRLFGKVLSIIHFEQHSTATLS